MNDRWYFFKLGGEDLGASVEREQQNIDDLRKVLDETQIQRTSMIPNLAEQTTALATFHAQFDSSDPDPSRPVRPIGFKQEYTAVYRSAPELHPLTLENIQKGIIDKDDLLGFNNLTRLEKKRVINPPLKPAWDYNNIVPGHMLKMVHDDGRVEHVLTGFANSKPEDGALSQKEADELDFDFRLMYRLFRSHLMPPPPATPQGATAEQLENIKKEHEENYNRDTDDSIQQPTFAVGKLKKTDARPDQNLVFRTAALLDMMVKYLESISIKATPNNRVYAITDSATGYKTAFVKKFGTAFEYDTAGITDNEVVRYLDSLKDQFAVHWTQGTGFGGNGQIHISLIRDVAKWLTHVVRQYSIDHLSEFRSPDGEFKPEKIVWAEDIRPPPSHITITSRLSGQVGYNLHWTRYTDEWEINPVKYPNVSAMVGYFNDFSRKATADAGRNMEYSHTDTLMDDIGKGLSDQSQHAQMNFDTFTALQTLFTRQDKVANIVKNLKILKGNLGWATHRQKQNLRDAEMFFCALYMFWYHYTNDIEQYYKPPPPNQQRIPPARPPVRPRPSSAPPSRGPQAPGMQRYGGPPPPSYRPSTGRPPNKRLRSGGDRPSIPNRIGIAVGAIITVAAAFLGDIF